MNSVEGDPIWFDDAWATDGEHDATWRTSDDTTWQPQPTETSQSSQPPQAVSAVTTSTSQPFRPQSATSVGTILPQQVGAVIMTQPTYSRVVHSPQPPQTALQVPTKSVSRASSVRPSAGLSVSTLVCGIHVESELRLILDSGATFHVCPLRFGKSSTAH